MGSTTSVALKYLGALTAAGAIATAASMAWATAPVAAASQFVVGFANPITGAEATYGVSDQHAVEMAAAQINKAGGVLGQQIKIISCDTQATPAIGVACANAFVSDHVNAVIGFFNSSISIPASAILHTANIPMVTGASTNPTLTLQGFKNVFRLCGTDNYQGAVEADFAYKQLHVKRVVVLNDEETYGQGVSSFFSSTFKKLGGTVVAPQGINAAAADFSSVLTQIKGITPAIQAIQFGGFNPAAGLLVKQARALGITVPFITDDGVIGPLFYQTGGAATVGSYLSSAPSPQDLAHVKGASKPAQTFLKAYVAKYGQPTNFAAYNYDCLYVLASAAKAEHGTSAGDLIKGLAATHKYQGVTGIVNFNKIGNNVTPQYLMYKVQSNGANKIFWNPNA